LRAAQHGRAPPGKNKKIFFRFPKQFQHLPETLRACPDRRATGQDIWRDVVKGADMRFTKAQVLQEIKRTAKANHGTPLGIKRFARETGILESECIGVYWARWSDAVREAGLSPNQIPARISRATLIKLFVEVTKEMGRLPASSDLQLRRRTDNEFPSVSAYYRRFQRFEELHRQAAAYCRGKAGLEDVGAWCERGAMRHPYEKAKNEEMLEQNSVDSTANDAESA
jgi:hypothetical protein